EGNPHDTVLRAYTVPIMQSCSALLDKLNKLKVLRRK
ncbi:MAG: hypothetical protein ACI9ON_004380, partial [Limisphaerales bacterium]